MTTFVVDTQGGCFMCLKKTGGGDEDGENIINSNSSSSPSSILSLSLLTRFLKLELGVVFEKLPLSSSSGSDLLLQEHRNGKEIGVPACAECAALVGEFSQLAQQLELLRLKVEESVRKIQGVIMMASPAKQDLEASSTTLETLRREVVHKCSELISQPPSSKYPFTTTSTSNLQPQESESGTGTFICTFCPGVFSSPDAIRTHVYLAHTTRILEGNRDPRISQADFDHLVRKLFEDELAPPRDSADGWYSCPLCGDNQNRSQTLDEVMSHLIPAHMQEIVERLKNLQEMFGAPIKRSRRTRTRTGANRNDFAAFEAQGDPLGSDANFGNDEEEEFTDIPVVVTEPPKKKRFKKPIPIIPADQITFTKLESGGFQCSVCSKMVWHERNLAGHKLIHTGGAPALFCDFCKSKSFRNPAHLLDHKVLKHQSEFFKAHLDPSSSTLLSPPERFEALIAKLFKSLIPERISFDYKCVFCQAETAGLSIVNSVSRGRAVGHYLREHMDQLIPRLKELQENEEDTNNDEPEEKTDQRSGPTPTFTKLPNNMVQCSLCSKIVSKTRRTFHKLSHRDGALLQCDHCSSSFINPVALQDHKFFKHRSSFFPEEWRDGRLSSDQFDFAVGKLLGGLRLEKMRGALPNFRCCFCESYRDGRKHRIYLHIFKNHMALLSPTLKELQEGIISSVLDTSQPQSEEAVNNGKKEETLEDSTRYLSYEFKLELVEMETQGVLRDELLSDADTQSFNPHHHHHHGVVEEEDFRSSISISVDQDEFSGGVKLEGESEPGGGEGDGHEEEEDDDDDMNSILGF